MRADDYKAVKLSSQIRTDLATIKKDAARMRSLQVIQARLKPKEKRYLFGLIKVKVKEDVHIKDDIDHRAAIVELVMKHVDEVERVSQKYITQFSSSQKMSDILGNESSNLSGADILNEKLKSYTGIDASKKLRSLTDGVASVTVGRDNVDVEAGIKQIQRVNATMDTDILNIHKSVVELREVAVSMNDELKLQTAVVQELTAELDVELRQMQDLNTKLSDTLVAVTFTLLFPFPFFFFSFFNACFIFFFSLFLSFRYLRLPGQEEQPHYARRVYGADHPWFDQLHLLSVQSRPRALRHGLWLRLRYMDEMKLDHHFNVLI